MTDIGTIGIAVAFFAGVVSFLSPCVLPLVPGYVSYVAGTTTRTVNGTSVQKRRIETIALSICFVFGFSTVFIMLGASASALGRLVLSYRYELNLLGGTIVILFGLFMLGFANARFLNRDFRFHLSIPGGSPTSSYVLGLAFGFGWTPCIGPILGAILTASAASATLSDGIFLLAIYSTGLGVPFVLTAGFVEKFTRRIKAIGKIGRTLYRVAGVIMILMGIAMITGQLSALAYWLLRTVPFFSQIG